MSKTTKCGQDHTEIGTGLIDLDINELHNLLITLVTNVPTPFAFKWGPFRPIS